MKRVFLSLSGLLILSVCLLFGLPVSAEDNPTVRVGMYENSPKIFTDAHGNPSGFWVDIIEYIAGEEGWNVEYVPGTWDEGLTRLLNNQIDIMPDIAYSEERARLYDFTSEAVYVSWSSVYTRDDSEIQSILDLDGKTVVVLADSINAVGPEGIINLTRQFDVDCTFLDAHSYLDVFEMVASGEADAGVASKDFAGLHAEDFQLIHTPIIFQPASLRFALTRYAELSPSLQDRLDFHVNALKHDSGSILYSSIERWFGVKSEETFAFPEWLTWVLTSIGILFVLCLFGLYLMRVQVRRKTRDLRLEIEERKKIEETLNERERTFQTIAETTQDIICLHAPDYRFLYISPSCKKILGFDAAELIGSTPFELMHPEDTERLQTFFTEDGGKGESLFFECRVRNAAGDYRWFESVSNRIIDDDGTVTGYLTSSRDVTERKQREMEYRTILSATSDGFWMSDRDANLLDVNDATCRMLGYSREELLRMNIADIEAVENREEIRAHTETIIEKGSDRFESSYRRKDGSTICIEVSVTFLDIGEGRLVVYSRDITERKRIENLLKESEEKYRSLIEYSGDAILLTVPDGGIVAANPAAVRMFGWSEDEFCKIGRNGIVDVTDPRLLPLLEERRRTGKASGELTFIRKDGTKFPVDFTSIIFTDSQGIEKTSMVIRDITERKKTEEDLLLRARMLDSASDGICLFNIEGNLVYVNDMYCRIHGYEKDELIGMNIRQMDADSSPDWMDWLRDELHTSGTAVFESAHRRKDGSVLRLEVHSTDIEINGQRYNISVERDITERKQAEQKLRESEEKYRTLFETMAQGVVYQDVDGKITAANKAAERILGLTVEQMTGRTSGDERWHAIHQDGTPFPGEDHPAMIALRTGAPVMNTLMGVFHPLEDRYHWIVVNAIPLVQPEDKKPYQVYTTFMDITERYLAEEEIERKNREFLYFSSQVPGMLYQFRRSPDGSYSMPFANDAIQDIFGCEPDDVKESFEPIIRVVSPDDVQYLIASIEKSARELSPWEFEFTVRQPEQSTKTVWGRSIPELQADGSIQWFGFATDISERKKTEESLRASELFRLSLLENAPNPINVINPDTSIRYVNPALEKITGYSADELIGCKAPYPYWGNDNIEQRLKRLNHTMKYGTTSAENQFTRKNGEKFWVRITNLPVEKNGEMDYLLASWIDVTESRAAVDALRESEEKYRSLVQQALTGVYIQQKGNFVFVNPEFEKLTGYSEQELLGMPARKVIHPDDYQLVREKAIAMLKGQRSEGYEFRIVSADGTVRWAMETVASITYAGKQASLGSIMDITERKQNEETLRLSDTTLRSINEAVMAVNNEDKVIFWNQASEELFGVQRQDAVGRHLFDLIQVVEEYPGQHEEREKRLRGQGRNREEQLYRTPKGDIWVDAHAQAIEDNHAQYGWVVLASDITERRRMETALRESEDKFSEIFYANPNPMAIIARDGGRITDVNKAFETVTGYNREDCQEKTFTDLGFWLSNDDREQFIRAVMEKSVPSQFETQIRVKSGSIRDMSMSIDTIAIAGQPHDVITIHDITESKQMQEQLMVTDRLASVGELAAGIAHELNNPLTGVVGFSDLLMSRTDLPKDALDDIALINKEAIRASQVARHLLTFARKHPDEKQVVRINDVIRLVLELRAYEQKVNNIIVNLALDENLPSVLANEFQLQQVFINIIINAEFFMTQAHGRGTLDIVTKQIGDSVMISFGDDGPGVSAENLTHIFDPFFTTKEVGKGTGLGLSICYGIIMEHGGDIWAESEPGEGVKFVIEIPVFKDEYRETSDDETRTD